MNSAIREKIKKTGRHYPVSRLIIQPAIMIWLLLKLCFSARYRSERFYALFYKKSLCQPSTFTKENRYPVLFELAKKHQVNKFSTILSFGCSTGEEVFTLNTCFPEALITGVDINKWAIRKAKQSNNNKDKLRFHLPDFLSGLSDGYFDIVFALGVLQSSVNRKRGIIKSSRRFTFMKFEHNLIELDRLLKAGGLLIIDNTDYDFRETRLFEKYTLLDVKSNIKRNRPVFDRNNLVSPE
ncbi:MAG TPA: methyltransferase domain-containing protein, partial [Bacteroidales bacterium]|nr:methyltransferase domain-containing protein [Bacteroidales bacterium]